MTASRPMVAPDPCARARRQCPPAPRSCVVNPARARAAALAHVAAVVAARWSCRRRGAARGMVPVGRVVEAPRPRPPQPRSRRYPGMMTYNCRTRTAEQDAAITVSASFLPARRASLRPRSRNSKTAPWPLRNKQPSRPSCPRNAAKHRWARREARRGGSAWCASTRVVR